MLGALGVRLGPQGGRRTGPARRFPAGSVGGGMAAALLRAVLWPLPPLAPLRPLAWRTSSRARRVVLMLTDPPEPPEEWAAWSRRARLATGAAVRTPGDVLNQTFGPYKTEVRNTLRGR